MKILITGATGFVGGRLTAALLKHYGASLQLTILTRNPDKATQRLGNQHTYLSSLSELSDLNNFDTVINLAGEPIVAKRWSKQQKQKICQSRWQITEHLSQLFQISSEPPASFISASAIGFYGSQGKQKLDESSPSREEFSHHICEHWEKLALDAAPVTRVCILRIGIVLGTNGGALSKMLPPFKLGLGGPIGNGEQGMSWVHIDDLCSLILFLIQTDTCQGIFNGTAPNPVSNREFAKALGTALNKPAVITTPAFIVKLAMGEMSELVTQGQYVYPTHATEQGFDFKYPFVTQALTQILTPQ